MDGGLDFGKHQASAHIDVMSPAAAYGAVAAAIVSFVIAVWVSAWLVRRWTREPGSCPKLELLSAPLRVLAFITLLVLLAVQLMGAVEVYVQTRVVHASSAEYFAYLSVAKLVGMSHAHLFGYALLYGSIAFLASSSNAGDATKAWLVAGLAWAGPFDIASWWGMKLLDGRFELLSYATAAVSVVASLVALWHVGRVVPPRGTS